MAETISLTVDTNLELMMKACRVSLAQENLIDFISYMMEANGKAFIKGRHTIEVCARIDRALELLFKHKISSHILITLPFRHGKSEIVSRMLPIYVMGKYSQPQNNPHKIELETILGSYAASLSKDLSKDGQRALLTPEYKEVFPHIHMSKVSSAAEEWAVDYKDPLTGITRQVAKFHACGIGGSVTGKGASLLIIDDILKNRKEAESQTFRDSQWDSYKDDFLTRLAPQSLHILCATRWHIDDVLGRVLDRNNPEGEFYDPDFPKFEVLHYRAKADDGSYLFPERFDRNWYERQFATLGPYSAPALLQGDPIAKGGNMLPTDKIRLIDSVPPDLIQKVLQVRFWDLASTEKEVNKDDPDATVGCRGFVVFPGATRADAHDVSRLKPHFFVTDVRSCRLLATSRNAMIVETAKGDGASVQQGIESVAGYKDSADTLKALLRGVSTVQGINVRRDKVVRASEVVPPMDAGWVYFVRGWWNTDMITELSQFPSGKHDDYVDALSGCYAMAYARALKMLQSGYLGGAGFSSGRSFLTPTSMPDKDPFKEIEEEFNKEFGLDDTTEGQIPERD